MAGMRLTFDVEAAKIASGKYKGYLKSIGVSSAQAEKEGKKLEDRFSKRLGADKAKKSLEALSKSAKLTKVEIAGLQVRSGNLGGAWKTLTGGTNKLYKSVFNLKTAFIGLGGVLVFRKAINEFSNFQTAITDLGKVGVEDIGAVRLEMERMPKILGDMTSLTKGYYQTISAGVTDPQMALKSLTATSKAAKAAHIGQSEIIKGLTKIMAGYGGEIKTTTKAADLLFTIEKIGQTTVAELIPVIGGLASVSKELGITQYEMGASLAQASQFAGSTAEAATQYQAVLTGLMKPTQNMIDLFEDMGGAQEAIKEIGFVNVLKKIEDATGGSQIALGKLLGRKEAALGFISLMKNDFEGLTYRIDEMEKSTGATDRAFEKWSKTFEATKQIYDSTIKKVLINFGEQLMPAVQKGMLEFSDWIDQNDEEILEFFKSLGTVIEGVGKVSGILFDKVSWFPKWGADIGIVLGAVKEEIIDLNDIPFIFPELLHELATSLNLDPALVKLKKDKEGISEQIKELKKGMESIIDIPFVEKIQGFFDIKTQKESVIQEIKSLEQEYKEITNKIIEYTKDKNKDLIKGIKEQNQELMDSHVKLFKEEEKLRIKIQREKLKLGKETKKEREKLGKELLKFEDKMQKDMIKGVAKGSVLKLRKLKIEYDKQKDLHEKLNKDHSKLDQWYVSQKNIYTDEWLNEEKNAWLKTQEIADKTNKEKLESEKDLINAKKEIANDLNIITNDTYQFELDLIRKKAENYRKLGVEAVDITKWQTEEEKKLWQEKTLVSNDFFGGIKVGFQKMQQDATTWGQAGAAIFETFSQKSSSSISNILFDGMTGKMKSMEDYWNNWWQSMLKTALDYSAKIAVEATTAAAVDIVGGLLGFKEGTLEIKENRLAVVHKGEMIIPSEHAENVRGMLGKVGTSYKGFNSEMQNVFSQGVLKAWSKNAMTQGLKTIGPNFGLESFMMNTMGPGAFGMSIGQGLGDLVGKQKYGEWINDKFVNQMQAITSIGLGIVTGPLGALAGFLAAPAITRFLGEFIGDAFNIRGIKDALETKDVDEKQIREFMVKLDRINEVRRQLNIPTWTDKLKKMGVEKETGMLEKVNSWFKDLFNGILSFNSITKGEANYYENFNNLNTDKFGMTQRDWAKFHAPSSLGGQGLGETIGSWKRRMAGLGPGLGFSSPTGTLPSGVMHGRMTGGKSGTGQGPGGMGPSSGIGSARGGFGAKEGAIITRSGDFIPAGKTGVPIIAHPEEIIMPLNKLQNNQEIHIHLNLDGQEIREVIISGLNGQDSELIETIREVSHG